MKQSNPGALEGTEIIFVGEPFGGIVSQITATDGVVPNYIGSTEGIEGATIAKQASNQYASSDGISLFTQNRFGHISPGPTYSPITDTDGDINDLPLNGDMATNGNAIVMLKNARLVPINPIIPAVIDSPELVDVATAVSNNNGDMIIFRDGATPSVEWVVWTWESSSTPDIAIVQSNDLVTGLDTDFASDESLLDFDSFVFGVPHKLCIGPDGNIYVTNGDHIQQINTIGVGLTSATLGNSLSLATGFIAQGICSYKNYVAIIAVKNNSVNGGNSALKSQVRVYLWDGLQTNLATGVVTTTYNYVYDIPDNFGQAIYYDGINLYVFTSGRNFSSKIFVYSGVKGFKKTFETPFISPSNTPLQGKIETMQDSLLFASTKGGAVAPVSFIFRYYEGGFHCESPLGTTTTSVVGMVRNFYQNWLFVGFYDGANYSIYANNATNTYATSVNLRTILYTEGILGRRQYPLGFKGTVTRIQIYLSQWGTGASLLLSLFKDYTTMTVAGSTDLLNLQLDTVTATPESTNHHAFPVGTTEIDITDVSIPNLSSFYMNLQFNHALSTNTAAIIRRMIVHWSPSQ